jgi:hypothetical protein
MKKALLATFVGLALLVSCDGNKSSSPPVEVVPIMIASPDNGATLFDSQYIVAVVGSGYSFVEIEFYIDNQLVVTDSTYPYQYSWNIFVYDPDIIHPIYAVGVTAEDSTYMSDVVLVTIDFAQGFSIAGSYQPGSQNAVGVVNYYNVLFVSLGDAGLEMLDVRDKVNPAFLARYDTPGQALHADVLFPNVFIADRSQGVTAADFSDVDSIMFSDAFSTQSFSNDVAVSEHFLFIAENDGLSIVEFDTDNQFNFLGRLGLPQDILNYVVARHDTAFVAGNNAFYIIDCTLPGAPDLLGRYNSVNQAQAVAVADTFAFIAYGSGGLLALSIAEPTSPVPLAAFTSGENMVAVDAGDGMLFAGANNGSVYALSYSTPGLLNQLDQITAANLLEEIDYDSNYLYVAAHTNVDILRFVR